MGFSSASWKLPSLAILSPCVHPSDSQLDLSGSGSRPGSGSGSLPLTRSPPNAFIDLFVSLQLDSWVAMNILWSCIIEGLHKYVNPNEKMQKLKQKMDILESREADKSIEVQILEFRTGRKRKREVVNWLRNVQSKKDEVRRIEQEFYGSIFLPRISLWNQIEKMTKEVDELLEQNNFAGGLTVDVHKPLELLTVKLVGQKAKESMKKLLACVMDDRVFSIGIYGMGGAGKTALAMHIHNELLKNPRSYGHVYWITVSQQSCIYELQGDIAKVLRLENLPSGEKERQKRAATLSRALVNRKETVLILDDMWEHFTPKNVGIPIGPDGPKLILTTRSLSVCRQMGSQEIIKVEPLSNDEAWELFMEKLELHGELSPDVKVVAMSMAEECRGLSLGIITMARSMRGVDDIREWRTAVKELRESKSGRHDMEEEVFSILRISYGRLKDPIVQKCFLYCALYPEDSEMEREELIKYFIAEGLIDGMGGQQAEFDKGHTILNELENSCLLENATSFPGDSLKVKMHDLVRDMALQISGKGSSTAGPRFLVKAGLKLREIPEDWAQDLERVSLMRNDITEIKAGISPRCPKLLTLMLQENRLKKIPGSFFLQMCALKVLDLSRNEVLQRLPNTISDLENLTALLLRYCRRLKYVPSLAKLQALKELDLGKTGIEKAPEGMVNLVNLKVLYMDCLKENVVVGEEILPQMRDLEKFVGRIGNVRRHVLSLLSEIAQKISRLNAYYIMVRSGFFYDFPFYGFPSMPRCSKAVTLEGWSVNTEILVHLFPNIDYLRFNRCHDLRALPCGTFSSLKELEIVGCPKIKKLFTRGLSHQYLPSLETIRVRQCEQMEEIVAGEEEREVNGTFSSLKVLEIEKCPKIKKLFTRGLLQQYLPSLETIRVWYCDQMEEIVAGEEEREVNGTFSSVKVLEIVGCPKIKKLFTRGLPQQYLPSLETIKVCSCEQMEEIVAGEEEREVNGTFSSLKVLQIVGCPKIKKLFPDRLVRHLQNLELLGVCRCDNIEEIVGEAEENDDRATADLSITCSASNNDKIGIKTIHLPKLRYLELWGLPELKSIYRRKMVCDTLLRVGISKCPKLKRLPLYLPLHPVNGQPSPPPALRGIITKDDEWWESLVWDHPAAKPALQPFLKIRKRNARELLRV
ncbi:probable disease resistance protein At1g12290 isoform X2 [Malania oleifera]|uniref:probable disease resistance protein At1g12290 isoform X2 n=1 Tax=Malania oleifera TaxID=397392 RepID=UPI0025ADA348|nr:probable disease resistance protein At1g12290 isoform X2 [Malania oleifera]